MRSSGQSYWDLHRFCSFRWGTQFAQIDPCYLRWNKSPRQSSFLK